MEKSIRQNGFAISSEIRALKSLMINLLIINLLISWIRLINTWD